MDGFGQVFVVGVAVAVAPGPDFFMVLRNSLMGGRLAGVMTALGIGSALVIHVLYSVLGLALVIASSPTIFSGIRVCGALYLLYIAGQAFFQKQKAKEVVEGSPCFVRSTDSFFRSWREGLWCNLLNPKAALFFLSIFSQFMTPKTPSMVRWLYGAEIIVIVTVWFVLVALFLSAGRVRQTYQHLARWVDRSVGCIFGGVACSILWQEARRIW